MKIEYICSEIKTTFKIILLQVGIICFCYLIYLLAIGINYLIISHYDYAVVMAKISMLLCMIGLYFLAVLLLIGFGILGEYNHKYNDCVD